MTTIAYTAEPLGCGYSPPTFRLYVAPPVAAPRADTPGKAEWLVESFAADWLPVRLTWGVNGRASELRIRRVLGVGADRASRDRADAAGLPSGSRVRLVEVQARGSGGGVSREWFRGIVAAGRLVVDASDDGEVCEAVAFGPELLLGGKCVWGQWHAVTGVADALTAGSHDPATLRRASTFRSHLPVVFNAGGRPNAACASWRLDTRGLAATPAARVFDSPGRRVLTGGSTYEAVAWDPATAVRSLVEMVDDYAVLSPASLSEMPAELAECVLGEVAVDGMSLLDALTAVLGPLGYGYCIEPWADARGRHALRVFEMAGRVDGSRVRRPYMAPIDGAAVRAGDAAGGRAEVLRIEFVRDGREVVNDVTVVGSPVRRQVALAFGVEGGAMLPAWDTAEHDLDDWAVDDVVDPLQWGESTTYTAAQFDQWYTYGAVSAADSRHAFRSFAWNEDGALTAAAGEAGDLSGVAAAPEEALRRPRPVKATLLRDDPAARARNLPPQVLLGIDGDDDSWIQVRAVIWADRAGFTLPINPLWRWHPYACEQARNVVSGDQTLFEKYSRYNYLTLLNNALSGRSPSLALKLVGSVECDHAVIGRAARRASGSWPIVAAKVVRAGRRFAKSEVPAAGDPFGLGGDRHDVRDESAAAAAYAAQLRAATEDESGRGAITLRQLTRAYAPGDVIPGTRGRRIDLRVSGGGGSRAPVVLGVAWDFQPGRTKTDLVLGS